eukprot:scaffold1474_cov256-Pinguiococcus_pyrenoidosus.AAC.22
MQHVSRLGKRSMSEFPVSDGQIRVDLVVEGRNDAPAILVILDPLQDVLELGLLRQLPLPIGSTCRGGAVRDRHLGRRSGRSNRHIQTGKLHVEIGDMLVGRPPLGLPRSAGPEIIFLVVTEIERILLCRFHVSRRPVVVVDVDLGDGHCLPALSRRQIREGPVWTLGRS